MALQLFDLQQLAVAGPTVLIVMLVTVWFFIPHRFLLGLRVYYTSDAIPQMQLARAAQLRGSGKKARQKGPPNTDIDLGGAETLLEVPLAFREIEATKFFGDFSNLLFLYFVSAAVLAAGLAAHTYLGLSLGGLALALPAICAAASLAFLAKVDLLSGLSAPEDRAYAAACALVGFAAALAVLSLPAARLGLAWDVEGAAAQAWPLLTAAARARVPAMQDVPEVALSPGLLHLALAAAAAAVPALLFAPALRYARALWLQRNPPGWAAVRPRSDGVLAHAAVHLPLLLPLAACLLWVRPLAQDLWGLSQRQLVAAQAAALCAAGAGALAALRPAMQRYLDTALTAWYHVKHGGLAKRQASRGAAAEVIRGKLAAVRYLAGRAAVQYLAPGVLLGALGLALGQSAAVPQLSTAADANLLVETVAGFLAWWACAVWALLVASLLWLFRTGTLAN